MFTYQQRACFAGVIRRTPGRLLQRHVGLYRRRDVCRRLRRQRAAQRGHRDSDRRYGDHRAAAQVGPRGAEADQPGDVLRAALPRPHRPATGETDSDGIDRYGEILLSGNVRDVFNPASALAICFITRKSA